MRAQVGADPGLVEPPQLAGLQDGLLQRGQYEVRLARLPGLVVSLLATSELLQSGQPLRCVEVHRDLVVQPAGQEFVLSQCREIDLGHHRGTARPIQHQASELMMLRSVHLDRRANSDRAIDVRPFQSLAADF